MSALNLETALIIGGANERVLGFSLEQLFELTTNDFFNGGAG